MTRPEDQGLTLTVGDLKDGRRAAIVSQGGHPQRPGSGKCEVLTIEDVTGWGRRKIEDWWDRVRIERPWETRQ